MVIPCPILDLLLLTLCAIDYCDCINSKLLYSGSMSSSPVIDDGALLDIQIQTAERELIVIEDAIKEREEKKKIRKKNKRSRRCRTVTVESPPPPPPPSTPHPSVVNRFVVPERSLKGDRESKKFVSEVTHIPDEGLEDEIRSLLVVPGLSRIMRRFREGLRTCDGESLYVCLLRDLISGVRSVHNRIVAFIKKARHYDAPQLRDFQLNYRLRFRRLWGVKEATVTCCNGNGWRPSVSLKDFYSVLYKPLYNTLYLQ